MPEGSDYHLCLKMVDKDKDRKCSKVILLTNKK